MPSLLLVLSAVLISAPQRDLPAPKAPVAVEQVVDSLVRQLGDERYDQREAATKALAEIGWPALKRLEEAAKSDDPEVRLRARKIVGDLRLGITPDWPAEMALQARHIARMEENERARTIGNIAQALKEKAVPFLLDRMAQATRDADSALTYLRRMDSDDAYRKVLDLLGEPKTPQQERALALARARMGESVDLAIGKLDAAGRREIIEQAIKQVRSQLTQRQYKEAAESCGRLAKDAGGDSRIPYLQAEALAALEKDDLAKALREQALAMNPDSEPPHYAAGEMLMAMGRRRLAAAEWEAIIKMPPEESVYDVNACIRLSTIYEASGMFAEATKMLELGLDLFRKASQPDGGGMAIVGGTEEGLRTQLSRLRKKADMFPTPADAAIEDEVDEQELRISVGVAVKDGKEAELRRELASVRATMSITVQPAGLRIFDLVPAALAYDREKKQMIVTLNGTRCGEPVPFEANERKVRVAVNTLDCCYIFEVDMAGGKSEKVARFEKDYTLKLQPGVKLAALTDVTLQINDKKYEWEKVLKDGIALDCLPDALKIVLEGTTPAGKRITAKITVPLQEPDLTPEKPEKKEQP